MKRPMNLIASIFGTVANAVQAVVNLLSLYAFMIATMMIFDTGNVASNMIMLLMFGVSLILELLIITALVLCCCNFPSFSASPEKYKARRKLTIATIVFNFLIIALFIVYFASGTLQLTALLLNGLSMALLLASNVLYIVDLCREKKRVDNAAEVAQD